MKNRHLLIALVLGTALSAAAFFIDIRMVFFAPAVPFFCAQLLLLRKTKRLWLRLLPVYPIVLLLLAAGYYWFFGTGWDALAALIFGLMSIGPAVGCVVAAAVHHFVEKAPRSDSAG